MSNPKDNKLEPIENSAEDTQTGQPESRFKIPARAYNIACLVLGIVFIIGGIAMWLLSNDSGFMSFALVGGCGGILVYMAISSFRSEKRES